MFLDETIFSSKTDIFLCKFLVDVLSARFGDRFTKTITQVY
ncbi:hypothetical protein [Nostoc sp. FACHB-280]|nr:hypothetical protein [Nostoc sp. FACHB-280]